MSSLRPFIIVVISIAALYFYAMPQWDRIGELKARNSEIQTALGKAQELNQIRTELMGQYNSISPENTAKIARVVPAVYDPVKLVADVNALALQYGMTIRDIKFADTVDVSATGAIQAAAPAQPYIKRDISFTTKGQYRNFISFLSDVEQSLQLMDVQKIDISGGTQVQQTQGTQKPVAGSTNGNLDFKVTLHTYWIK